MVTAGGRLKDQAATTNYWLVRLHGCFRLDEIATPRRFSDRPEIVWMFENNGRVNSRLGCRFWKGDIIVQSFPVVVKFAVAKESKLRSQRVVYALPAKSPSLLTDYLGQDGDVMEGLGLVYDAPGASVNDVIASRWNVSVVRLLCLVEILEFL
ncbi:hypothetical protein RRG08_034501 [Elysia crispata]|uniref:Uncharacterized protein n=1 Tax=Elysia crispata TaxID=231223 RepID=A0AAE1BA47_9GAST|nr:hypothetical protein RRG08_034501 [Elysia crispata]